MGSGSRARGQLREPAWSACAPGIVLERDGGALPQMLPPFWFGAGGPVGSGRQYWPWIHRADWINLVCWVLRVAGRDRRDQRDGARAR